MRSRIKRPPPSHLRRPRRNGAFQPAIYKGQKMSEHPQPDSNRCCRRERAARPDGYESSRFVMAGPVNMADGDGQSRMNRSAGWTRDGSGRVPEM